MIDQVQMLLLNPADATGYRRVADAPADAVMALFGIPAGYTLASPVPETVTAVSLPASAFPIVALSDPDGVQRVYGADDIVIGPAPEPAGYRVAGRADGFVFAEYYGADGGPDGTAPYGLYDVKPGTVTFGGSVAPPPALDVSVVYTPEYAAHVAAEAAIGRLMPLALAPDLLHFRRFYDSRVTPRAPCSTSSVYRQANDALSPAGLYDRVLGRDGWWHVAGLFQHEDPGAAAVLGEMRAAATSGDAPYALGAILLAVAYRRWLLQGGGG